MNLVLNYNFLITFPDGNESKKASQWLTKNKSEYKCWLIPTPIEIESVCGWCLAFKNIEILRNVYTILINNNINIKGSWTNKEQKEWKKI